MTTSDATLDTPVDPDVHREAVLAGAIALNGGNERYAMERYDSTSEIVVRALAEAGLLRGSLRSQASGTPMDTGEEP